MDKVQIVLRDNWRFCLESQELSGQARQENLSGREEQAESGEYPFLATETAWYKGYDDSVWRRVTLPHDWSVEYPFSRKYSSGTGYLAGGTGWYRVHFLLPEEYRGKNVRVVFDGVYKNSQVWCNSYYLGKRPYGYSTFSYDITHAAAFGDTENVISVKVKHEDIADSRWFTGSGITRKVSLVIQETVHPAEYGVVFRTERVVPGEERPAEQGVPGGKEPAARLVPEEESVGGGVSGGKEPAARLVPEEESAKQGVPGAGNPAGGIGRARVSVRHTVAGAEEPTRVKIRTVLEDAAGKSVLTLQGEAGAGASCTLEGELEQARLWSPEQPYLYTLRTWYAVSEREGEAEEFYLVDESRVGIRGFSFDPEKGFFLNGRETKLKGVCVHHDGGALGAAMEPEVWQRRLEALKECGCNAIRCSHNPHMPELYDLCDRMGFLMMDEAFDEWENAKNKWSTGHNVYPPRHQGYFEDFPEWHEEDLRAMVRRDRNHPSVILWSIGNEIDYPNDPYCHPSFGMMTGNNDANKSAAQRQYDPCKPDAERLVTIAGELEKIVRQEDDSRPVTLAAAFPELSAETGLLAGLDVAGYNYKEHLYEQDHARFPDLPLLGSENGHGYKSWLAVRNNSYISGQFLWTGIDYLGEAHGWPIHGSGAGILTLAGDRKPEFYRRKAFWVQEPVLALATRRVGKRWQPAAGHWNYEPGEEVQVEIYTNLPEVRLSLNGREIGCLSGAYNLDGAYGFRVRWEPGVLTVEGYGEVCPGGVGDENRNPAQEAVPDKRMPTAVCRLETADAPRKVSVSLWQEPDRLTGKSWEEASREPGYLYQMELRLLDGQGRRVRGQEELLTVTVEGDGQLAGLESGNLADVTPYCQNSRRTLGGRLLAFVRRTGEGEIRVRVSAEGETAEESLTEERIVLGTRNEI
ncbi:MAG: DUF4982 domain-containing protein [Roseburia sp.]|nr:DUF4982 domain-containing protein [Roseburia sp.]MCM1097149.1 DUF4982 domain-containing protein [Ruminococcus flavefaciens]